MATVWKHPASPFWMAVYRDEQNRWRKKTTKLTNRSKALELSLAWERAAQLARDGVLTEAVCREVIGGILERTSGEKLRTVTTRTFCQEWMRGKTHSRQDATSTRYGASIERFLSCLKHKADMAIAAVTPVDCQSFYDYLSEEKLAPATLVVEMKTIGSVFNHARRLGLIPTNPVTSVELPQRIKQVRRKTFTPEQIQMLLDAAEPEWRTVILLGFYSGLRLGDAITLAWENINFTSNKIHLETHKTGDTLEIPLHPVLESRLSGLAGDAGGPICPALAAVPIGGRSGLSKQFLAIMRKAGISNDSVKTGGQRQLSQLSFHALRASFNSALHNRGVDQELRKKLTGHKSAAVNDRYTATELGTLREAVNKLPTLKV